MWLSNGFFELSIVRSMEDTLERRITALEERLGLLPIGTEATSFNSSIDFDLPALRQKITDAGCGFILKIPSEDVKKLNDLINQVNIQPEYLTFAEKQRAIEFGYDLMVERARLLEEFEKGFQVIDSDLWNGLLHHEDELNGVEKEINEVVEDVRVGCAQQLELRSNFNLILKELHEQVKGWQTMLDDLESAEAGEK